MAAGSAANMKGPRELPVAPDSKVISQGSERGHPRSKPNLATLSPRLVLGAGFVVLAAFSAASIGFDVKSRSEAAWVNHTLEVSNKFADMRLLFRHTESSARGYLLSGDRYFADDYHQRLDRIAPAFTALKDAVKDNDAQLRLLASTEALVVSRFSVTSEALRLHMAGDVAGMAALTAKADGRTLMESVDARFDQLAKEEQRLLGVRSAESERTGGVLLAIELSCAALILILASILIGEGRRSSRKQQTVQRATEAANETLEAAVLERTGHMHAANEKEDLMRTVAFKIALCIVSGGAVLAAELLNTALEHLADRLHPEQHPVIRTAKDCAAAAVLLASISALLIGLLTLAVGLHLLDNA